MMKAMGLDAYRFSISWSRIFPDGKGRTSNAGIRFYEDLLNELEKAGIKAFVTLFHWDTPLKLEQEYNGWLNPNIADDFANYAEFCFQTFGEKVDKWVTLNEPFGVAHFAYVKNIHAPGFGDNYIFSPIKPYLKYTPAYPYIVSHNLVLAHAKAVKKFREYQRKKMQENRGYEQIGITLNSKWFEPKNPNHPKDVEAAGKALDFYFGWFLDPLVHGKYPHTVDNLTPQFSDEEKNLIQHSYDFIGINYYTAEFVSHRENSELNQENSEFEGYESHQELESSEDGIDKDGKKITIGEERGASSWLISHPAGIQKLLMHVKNNYNNPVIYITENGIDDDNLDHKGTTKQWTSLFDEKRLSYIRDHLDNVLEAMKKGVNVRGYFTWSLLDNFEWNNCFNVRFGLVYVDYHHPERKRYLKLSSTWLKHCLLKGKMSRSATILTDDEEKTSLDG